MSTETPWPTPLPSPPDGIPQQPPRTALLADIEACGALTGSALVLAFAVGALWRATAPAVLGVVNQGSAYLAEPEGKTFVGRDGWYALYACIAALLLGALAFLRYRKAGSTGAAIGLAGGGIAGGYLAAWFGGIIGPGHGSITRAVHGVADGATFNLPMTVRATGVIWLWPAVAAGLFFFLLLLFGPIEPEPEQGQQADQQLFPVWGEQHGNGSGNGNGAVPGFGASGQVPNVSSGGSSAEAAGEVSGEVSDTAAHDASDGTMEQPPPPA